MNKIIITIHNIKNKSLYLKFNSNFLIINGITVIHKNKKYIDSVNFVFSIKSKYQIHL